MNELVINQDIDGIKKYFAEESVNCVEDVLSARLERNVRERGLLIAGMPDQTVENAARAHLNFTIQLCSSALMTKSTAVSMLQDMFEVSRIGRCERLFFIVEENMPQFQQASLADACKTFILRMCNDLLKRLSRTMETSFCGRILFFLSRFLPLSEKSGLNLIGNFNVQNDTKFDTTDTQPIDLMATTSVDEDVEMGEIKETKEAIIPVDHALYSMFWQMQTFFSNPVLCYDNSQWSIFHKNVTEVLNVFTSYKLERSGNENSESDENNKHHTQQKRAEEMLDEADAYFAKYLTSPKLLQLQLNDSQFRRYFLLQCLIIFQYLTAEVKFKQKTQVLSEEQSRFVADEQEKCYKLLRETHPRGSVFADNVKSILSREKEWSAWKNQSCPDMEQRSDEQPMQLYRKRPRTCFNPAVIDVGSAELTKLWNIEPDLLASCRNKKRKFAPALNEFLRDPLDEMDPEQQVDEEYKSINNAAYQWRACRYLMSNSSQYFAQIQISKETSVGGIGPFLEQVIYNSAKNMEEFKTELNEREEREARKLVEQSMLKKLKEKEGSASPGPDSEVGPETLERLSELLSDKLSTLIDALETKFKKENDEEDTPATLRLLTEWSAENGNSVRKLRNTLLSADVLSSEIINLLKNPESSGSKKSEAGTKAE